MIKKLVIRGRPKSHDHRILDGDAMHLDIGDIVEVYSGRKLKGRFMCTEDFPDGLLYNCKSCAMNKMLADFETECPKCRVNDKYLCDTYYHMWFKSIDQVLEGL